MEKRMLNKSQINLFLQCPLKWKFIHIDNLPSQPSSQQQRGSNIHKKIEEFYKTFQPDVELKNFIKFERKRLEGCKDLKYFYPLYQELKIVNNEINLYGTIDAVYINEKDDGIIIVDWKTGHFSEEELNGYRFELALYKELLERSKKVDKVKYWAIYFTDQDKLFFEEVERKWIDRMFRIINKIREEMESGKYKPKRNYYCNSCQFKNKCELMKNVF